MIGIFDSGIGGLSVYLEIKKKNPNLPIVFLSDSANFPFGEKSDAELDRIVEVATKRLIEFGVNTIVVACNSATVSSVKTLRDRHPEVTFFGVEPAIKLAARISKSVSIGLLATKKTVHTHNSESLAPNHRIVRHFEAALINKIEHRLSAVTENDLDAAISPLLEQGVDTIVLGCTHFYFIKGLLEKRFPDISFIEPAEHVAREVLAKDQDKEIGQDIFLTTGDLDSFSRFLTDIITVRNADIRKI